MADRKLLIDTNVFIGLEDQREVVPEFAEMLRLCAQYRVRVFVHELAIDDIKRDTDADRRKISLSKVRKFEQLTRVAMPHVTSLVTRFGSIPKPNDVVDVALLHSLDASIVDMLITQDLGIHGRARRCTPPLADRVLTVSEAVAWLRTTYVPQEVRLPLVEELPAHAVSTDDDIFESLRDGYPGFDTWWREKCVRAHRQCWAVTIDNELAGLVVRKDETHAEAQTQFCGSKILKVCTFKVKPKFRGEKLGELLLKQILWFAQRNAYDLVYLTTFEDQHILIRVLEYFGFEMTGRNALGEKIYEKPLPRERLEPYEGCNLFELDRKNYPRFVSKPPATAHCVPIRGEYHKVLFPELASYIQADLFPLNETLGAIGTARTPGNTIRKVYLCRARIKVLPPGSILLFYNSKTVNHEMSQSMTSVGVVETVTEARGLDDLVRLTAKRSVYSTAQLEDFGASGSNPVKVIDFLLVGHIEPAISLRELVGEGIFRGYPPQSICRFSQERFERVRRRLAFGFEV